MQRLRDRIAAWWPSASLRSYVIAIVLVATLPVVALMGVKIFGDFEAREEGTWDELRARASGTSQLVEREIASSIDALTILGGTTLLASEDTAEFERALRVQPRWRPIWSGVFLLDADGHPLVDAGPIGAGPARLLALGGMRAATKPIVSGLVPLGAEGRWATAVVVPLRDANGLRYLLGAWIDAASWQELLLKSSPPADGFVTLVDQARNVIARTVEPQQFVGRTLRRETVAAMASGASGVHTVESSAGEPVHAAWVEVPATGWAVRANVAAAPLQAAMRQAIVTTVAGALLCVVLGLYSAFLVARHLLEPLRRLAAHGGAATGGRIVVREVAALRDALAEAQARDDRARARLQATADEFETLFGSSPIGLSFAHDPQCRDVTRNAAMQRLLGLDVAPGGPAQFLRHGVPVPRDELPLRRAAASGERVLPMALELVVPGRPRTHVLAQAVPLLDAQGRPRGAIGAFVDVTDQVLGDQELHETNERLRQSQRLVDLAQEAGHVGFFHYHFHADQLNWTEGQASLFGLAQREASRHEGGLRDWGRLIDPEDRTRVEATLRRVFASRQEKETVEYRVQLPDGALRWVSSRVLVLYGDDGRPEQMIGVSVDMTDEKLAEREHALLSARERTARIQAEAANRAKDEFLAMLGHELRNPLSAIAAAIEVLNRVSSDSEVAVNARNIAARQTRHLAHMMDDLLDVGRVVSGKVLLTRRPVELGALARRAVSTLEVTGEGREHVLRLDLGEAVWIDADATRIEQVLANLLTNATKYTPAGTSVTVSVRCVDGQAVLGVADDGPGIAPELLPRIFDLFVQGERTPDRRAGGLGLGLTLAKRLVELHGGTIAADSSGAGSRFEVRIPAIDAPAQAPVDAQRARARGRRVVLVEDNEDALEGLRATLELDGHAVVAARDGPSGLDALLQARPDVAIVDIGLPGMTGLELAKRSRAAGYGGFMIALSGYGRSADVQQALKHGFDTHLVKPVDAAELQRLLANA